MTIPRSAWGGSLLKTQPWVTGTCALEESHVSAEQPAAPGRTRDQATLVQDHKLQSQPKQVQAQKPGGLTEAYGEPVLLRSQS